MTPKRGMTFDHPHFTSEPGGPPLRCVVTKTRHDGFYWRATDGGRSWYVSYDYAEACAARGKPYRFEEPKA